ncbi:MAG TPA: exodeoxyribonuclease III [Methanospirillum sp.]|nr:exodeoxyribonuclease III [Methanospirillum sp.]
MTRIRIFSWNVNGIRAIAEKEVISGTTFPEYLASDKPDICCLQETKVDATNIPAELTRIDRYFFTLNPAERKGYSGVSLYSLKEPDEIFFGIDRSGSDPEGRTIIAQYPEFTLYGVYFPNGGASEERLAYKLRFYDTFLEEIRARDQAGERIIICGDVNTAHHPIDLARPKENETRSGFLKIERDWLDRLVDAGFIDTFRFFNQNPDNYTWWDYKTRARARNVGWRIDYFFVNQRMQEHLVSSIIRQEIMGSDHCPIELVVEF